MPWTAEDAKKHTAKADTPRKCEVWRDAANGELEHLLTEHVPRGEAEAKAIMTGNAAVARIGKHKNMSRRLRLAKAKARF